MHTVSIKRLLFALVFLTICTITADRIGILQQAENAFVQATAPMSRGVFQSASALRSFIDGWFASHAQNDALRAQMADYELQKSTAARLLDENTSLQKLLNYTAPVRNKIASRVIGLDTGATLQTLVVDKGSLDGVRKGNPVIAQDGVLVGVVWAVKEHIAYLQLITDNQSQIGASVYNTDHTIGIAAGSHGLSVEVHMIPQNETVIAGDVVVTSGIEQSIPRGLVIGSVANVTRKSSEPFQTARLLLPLDFNKLAWVAILNN